MTLTHLTWLIHISVEQVLLTTPSLNPFANRVSFIFNCAREKGVKIFLNALIENGSPVTSAVCGIYISIEPKPLTRSGLGLSHLSENIFKQFQKLH